MRIILPILLLCSSLAWGAEWDSKYVRVRASAYCPCEQCCGTDADGVTATGRDAKLKGVAVDRKLIPLGSRLDIPGYGNWQLADDVGGALKAKKGDKFYRIDVRFKTHKEALQWGIQYLKIRIWRKK